ncbi:DUF4199 domain-containing protein [Flavobacterium branchiophilum]|uniref:DUF4199 domain-containing protein n=1 Tax=Flavobacterium branchiophilum TaxID=55197 RepID=A0A2H3KQT4_9FLAO|nr:DUF4199 domain-containing protein [Flavobacterium branchiophilum]PDS24156.1 DUF4199 domain-containing protein [Flavobacterium branchiophilum]
MDERIKKNGITFGILSGLFSVLMTTIIYVVNTNWFTSWWAGVFGFTVSIIIGIVLLSKTQKEFKGDYSFKSAFTTFFICSLVSIFIAVIFNIILFNFIDPELKITLKQNIMKMTVETMQKFGARSSDINEAIKKMKESDQFSVIEQLKGTFFSIIIYSIIGLILAAFFKNKPAYKE